MIVVWRITERCNLSCRFCAYDRELPRPRRDADVPEVERVGRLLAEYQSAAGDPVLVSWLGGEPLLWPPLAKLTNLFVRDLRLRVSTTTNGTTLGSAPVRAHLLAHYTELTVSIDVPGEAHDQLRGWPGGFARLRQSITQLAREKLEAGSPLKLRVNTVLMRSTIAGFPQLCDELAGWGMNEITFNQLGGRDRPEFFPANRLLPEQVGRFAAQLPELRAQLAARGVKLQGGDGYIARFRASASDQRLPVQDCHPGEQVLFIHEHGLVAPCHFTTGSYGVPLRELRSSDDLFSLRERFIASRHDQRDAACDDCHSTHVFEKFAAA